MATLNRKYPHLLPDDIAIWERFLSAYEKRFNSFDYDVRVGLGRPADTSLPENIQKAAIALSQKRIDVVGHTDDAIMCIEITGHAGLKAIGQLVAYPLLYAETFKPTKPVLPLLVCAQLHPDVKPVLDSLKVPFYLV